MKLPLHRSKLAPDVPGTSEVPGTWRKIARTSSGLRSPRLVEAFSSLCVAILILLGITAFASSCGSQPPQTVEKTVEQTVVVTVPVVETRVVVETRDVPRTVVVTATPVPTPAYVSRITVPAGTLAYAISDEPAGTRMGLQEATDDASTLVAQQLYEGLYNLRADGAMAPAGATGYTVSSDGKVYTVTLRAEAKWSDGQPVTAQQYVDGVCRTLDPGAGNGYYYLLSQVAGIQGAADFASGDVANCKAVGVKAVNTLTLQVTLDRPAAFFPKLLAMRVFWPVRLDQIAKTPGTPEAATALVGNGPYKVAEWQPKDHITLTRNPAYWNAARVQIERIEFRIVPDSARQLALFEQGEVHVADFPAEETPRIQADLAFSQELRILVRPGTSYIGLNTESGPTQSLAFRRAVASAIDRQRLIRDVLKQPWHKASQVIVPPGVAGYQGDNPAIGIPYNPEAAKKYLAEAGYSASNPPPPVEIWTNREGNNELVLKAVGQMLEEVGIPVRLVTSSWDVYLGRLDDCNAARAVTTPPSQGASVSAPETCSFNLYRMGWVMDYADPSAILDAVFSPRSAFQYTGWQSKLYEETLAKALAEPDEAKRAELYRAAEKILLNDAVVVVPLQHYDRSLLVKRGVVFEYPPFGAPNLQYWTLP